MRHAPLEWLLGSLYNLQACNDQAMKGFTESDGAFNFKTRWIS